MEFKVIIDDSLLALSIGSERTSYSSNNLIGIVNDFEDGKWRYEKFNNFVWDNIADTALSMREREALKSKHRTTLIESAKNLRLSNSVDDISKGSELAEIVLYGIMKHKFKAIPVVPKIFYKQNSQDNAKGADSVHIVVGDDGRFTLWFGEKLKKENSIITNLGDLDRINIDDETRTSIRDSLSNMNSIDSLKEIINIPILLLHECSLTADASEITEAYLERVRSYHKERAISYFQKQADALGDIFKYSSLTFHLILFPVPKKEPIIESFISEVSHYRGKI